MTILLNLLGGPGVGKTSLGAQIFAYLKAHFINVEFVQEYVKSWVYEGKEINKYNQYTLFGIEVNNQSSLFNKVKFLIADSPVMLTAFYQYFYNKKNTLSIPCHDFYDTAIKENKIEVINFFLPRMRDYNLAGRYQTQEESDCAAELLKAWLNIEGYEYTVLSCNDEDRLKEVIKAIEKYMVDDRKESDR